MSVRIFLVVLVVVRRRGGAVGSGVERMVVPHAVDVCMLSADGEEDGRGLRGAFVRHSAAEVAGVLGDIVVAQGCDVAVLVRSLRTGDSGFLGGFLKEGLIRARAAVGIVWVSARVGLFVLAASQCGAC